SPELSRRRAVLFVLVLAASAAACGPDVDLTKALEFRVLESGYFDDGIHDGKTRFLPTLKFELHNNGDVALSSVQLLLSYYQQGADGEYDSMQATGVGPEGVAPGKSTTPVMLRAQHGYTFPGARADFFTASSF